MEGIIQYLIIPDIHGQADKLIDLLAHLGWRKTASGWVSGEPDQEIVFLGDFIDRGPKNERVIHAVRSLIDTGKAHAVMGNHELNAIHFHTNHPEHGAPLRPHSEKNIRQHQSFLEEFPHGSADAAEVIDWMRTLPLYREFPHFRAVHACWDEAVIEALEAVANGGILPADDLIRAADTDSALFDLVELTTKGPEVPLPEGYAFQDKDGTLRKNVRVQWWNGSASNWADIAMSVPEPDALPVTPLPDEVIGTVYPADAKPVFYGHYWLTGEPVRQSHNALCLDYSAGKGGPLLAYLFDEDTSHEITLGNILNAPA